MILFAILPALLFLPVLQYNPVPGLNGFLPIGSFFGAAVVCSRLFLGFVEDSHRRLPSVRVNKGDIFVFLFWALLVAPTVVSLSPRVSVKVLFDWSLATLMYVYVARIASAKEVRWIVWSFVGLTTIAAIIVFIQKSLDVTWPVSSYLNDELTEERLNFGDASAVRTMGIFLHANSQALFFSVLLPFCFGLLGEMRRGWSKLWISIAFGLGCIAQLLTLSRSGVLCVVAALISIFLLRIRSSRTTRSSARLFKGLFFWALSAVVVVGVLALSTDLVGKIEERFFSSQYAERDEGSAIARTANLTAGVNATIANPWFGIGPGMSPKIYFEYGGWRGYGPHNMYLLLSSEFGLPVLIAFIVLFFRFLSRAIRDLKRGSNRFSLSCAGALIAFAIGGLFESATSGVMLVPLFIVFGLISRARGSGSEVF